MPARFAADLNRALDKMRTGNARAPSLSPDIVELAKQAWLLASLEHGARRASAPATCWRALLADETLARARAGSAPASSLKHPGRRAAARLRAICRNGSDEAADGRRRRRAPGGAARCRRAAPPRGGGARSTSSRTDLTAQAQGRQDRPDPRPRRRDPPDHRHPDAAPPEQPDPHRRGRRRQDRGGRGLRAAHRRRRRAADALQGRAAAARSTSACCRPAPA